MGITIHYEGRLRSREDLDQVLDVIRREAHSAKWSVKDIDEKDGELEREIDGVDHEYSGAVKGIVVRAHEDCEPLQILFDEGLSMHDHCHTQYSTVETHVALIELFRKMAPHFQVLAISDEGEFWESGDHELLREVWADHESLLSQFRENNPDAEFKVRAGCRIIDAITNGPPKLT